MDLVGDQKCKGGDERTFGGSLLESLLTVDIANDAVLSFFGPDLRPN